MIATKTAPRHAEPALPALRMVRPPKTARAFAGMLVAAVVGLPAALLLVPWQQTVTGAGRVVAFDPAKRLQPIDAPIDGRLVKVYVTEGQHVKAGDLIADIADVDADLMKRLEAEVEAVRARKAAAQLQFEAETRRVEYVESAGRDNVDVAKAKLDAAKEQLSAARQTEAKAEADNEFARQDNEIHEGLYKQGLEPERLYLQTKARYQGTKAELKRTHAMVVAAQAAVRGAENDVQLAQDNARSLVEAAKVSRQTAFAAVQQAVRDMQMAENKVARQANQRVKAPVDGVVYRVTAAAALGSQLVKTGDPLAELVPDTDNDELIVELFIDGRDAPLVEQGRDVRLQFEGWPAVQFMGWPSVAAGTFGGTVAWIDPANDPTGKCRILVKEHKQRPQDEPWPHGRYLRQGNRANGWVFLNQVTLGYEIWRQVNGFPPVIAPDDPAKGKDKVDTGFKKKAK